MAPLLQPCSDRRAPYCQHSHIRSGLYHPSPDYVLCASGAKQDIELATAVPGNFPLIEVPRRCMVSLAISLGALEFRYARQYSGHDHTERETIAMVTEEGSQ